MVLPNTEVRFSGQATEENTNVCEHDSDAQAKILAKPGNRLMQSHVVLNENT